MLELTPISRFLLELTPISLLGMLELTPISLLGMLELTPVSADPGFRGFRFRKRFLEMLEC